MDANVKRLSLDWYFNEFATAINAKPHVISSNSHRPIANMVRCYNVVRIIYGKIPLVRVSPIPLKLTALLIDMEHWHVPYNHPRGDNVQAWLVKTLEGAIARDSDKECDWMFKQRYVVEPVVGTEPEQLTLPCSMTIEETGRPEPTKQRLPRLSNPFGKKNKPEWKVATLWDLIPELEQLSSDSLTELSQSSKTLPSLPSD